MTPAVGTRLVTSSVPSTGRLPTSPLLGAVTLDASGDGVAYVGRLMRRALEEIFAGDLHVATLEPRRALRVTRLERARFFARLAIEQRLGGRRYVLLNHLALARAQAAIPARLRRPYAVVLHGVEAWDPALSDDRRAAIRGASLRIAVSHHTREVVTRTHPDVGPVTACPLGLLPEATRRTDADRSPANPTGPTVVIVGRMSVAERYKGHDVLLDGWRLVLDRVPSARLVVVGRGDDAPRLRAKAQALGLAASTLFTGYVDESALDAILRRATVFAMPSRGEGFGLVYLEAMRRGVPCVGSRDDAASDVIVDGGTGFLVGARENSDRVRELAARLTELLEYPALARRMGEAGARRFADRFTFEAYRDRLRAILMESAYVA